MAELIRKDKLIDWSYREPTYYDSMNDRTDMRDFINSLPTTSEAEIRASVVDEFVNKAWEVLGSEDADIYARQSIIEIAEQMKERE